MFEVSPSVEVKLITDAQMENAYNLFFYIRRNQLITLPMLLNCLHQGRVILVHG